MNKNTIQTNDYSMISQDNCILEHYGLNELNFESIKDYRQRFSAIKPDHPWNGLETKEFLYKIGAWGKMRNTSKEGLTLAGLLMFSEERMITEVLPQYFLEYRENFGDISNGEWSDRFTSQDGTWSGNVYDFYFKVMDHITSQYTMFADEHSGLIRSSLHEAVINTIVHCDYYSEGGIVMEKEQSIFRFSNPGLLRTSIEQAVAGGISNLRNPNLFRMFILIDLCKRAGSGLRSIETAWRQLGWDSPSLMQDTEGERTSISLSMNSLKRTKDEETAVLYIEEEQLFPEEAGGKESSYNNELNSGNKGEYSYNSEVNSCNNEIISYNNELNSGNKGESSYNSECDSYNNGSNSGNNETNSCNSESENIVEDVVDTPQDHWDDIIEDVEEALIEENINEDVEGELWDIAELARKKKRLSPSTMEEIIVNLCAKRPLKLKELAVLLERTPDGLRNNYLAKLLSKGEIKLKYPHQVNHPRQAYMIVKKAD